MEVSPISSRPTGQPLVHLMGIPIAHMGSHAGYSRLLDYVGIPITIDGTRWKRGQLYRWYSTMVSMLAGMPWYSPGALSLECRAGLRMLRTRDAIYHVLQADNDLWFTPFLARLTKNRVVATIHQPPAMIEQAGGPWPAWKQVDAVIAVAKNQVNFLRAALPGVRVEFIPHGVDTDFFVPPLERQPLLNAPTFLCVGKHLRDFDVLEEVVKGLAARYPGSLCTVVGAPEARLESLQGAGACCRQGLHDDQLRELYQRSTIMILPLLESTANNALLEAMACGLPTVVTAVGGVLDYCDDSSAVLVERGEPEQMVQGAVDLLSDKVRYIDISTGARKRAQELSYRRVGRLLVDFYGSLR
jgi:glycosyltransferase involved in cell wall biosynthesis